MQDNNDDLFDLCLFLGPDPDDPACDPFTWFAKIKGPPGSPYAGGTFMLKLTVPQEYPFRSPVCEFQTPVFHPNISTRGDVCMDILRHDSGLWCPEMTLQAVVISVLSLLTDANPTDPLQRDVGKLFMRDRTKFDTMAREWTNRYAK